LLDVCGPVSGPLFLGAIPRAALERDQRLIVSAWGGREASEAGGLHDYANRQLSGLVSGLYAPRWRRYFTSLERALADGSSQTPIDWFTMEQTWADARTREPTAPRGDPWRLAARVADRLGKCGPLPAIAAGSGANQ